MLAEIHHVPIATVNADGSPHNSPVFIAFDENLNGFWVSSPESLHSKNISRTHQAFLTIFDSREGHGGIFIKAEAAELTDENEVRRGYEILRAPKEKFYGQMGGFELYFSKSPQRIYQAKPLQIWLNTSDRDETGIIIRDRRVEVKADDLL